MRGRGAVVVFVRFTVPNGNRRAHRKWKKSAMCTSRKRFLCDVFSCKNSGNTTCREVNSRLLCVLVHGESSVGSSGP